MRSVFLLAALGLAAAFEFDNALTESAKIECGRNSMTLNVSPTHGAPSYVFAKGHFGKEDCSFRNSTHATFAFDKCNVQRKREVNPSGIEYSMTVIVQLHPLFITKVDRAYNVRCFYMEAEKAVGAEMGVNELTTSVLQSEHQLPTCSYTLHMDSPNGPLAKIAKVGDVIYHVWDCPSDVYAMMIHSCKIMDGQGSDYNVIDERGCSTDGYLMPEVVYSKDLTRTFTASNAFNFPDRNTVSFNCQIKMCLKEEKDCQAITPPRCGAQSGERPAETSPVEHSLADDLDNEQLMTTSSRDEATTTERPTRVVMSVTEMSREAAGGGGETTTTTTLPPTTVIIETTTTTLAPDTTTAAAVEKRNDSFPTPKTLREFIADKYGDEIEGSIEGSGLEIVKNEALAQTASSHDEEVLADPHARREVRRREAAKSSVDMDISSPELTIITDMDFPSSAAAQLHSPASPAPSSAVCLPLYGMWLGGALLIALLSLVTVLLCYGGQRREHKFVSY